MPSLTFIKYLFCTFETITSKVIQLKEILTQYASYNVWANERIANAVLSQPAELQQKNMVSSFSSLQSTLQHIWYAENIWWQRLLLVENIQPVSNGQYSMDEIAAGLIDQSKKWFDWVEKSKPHALEHVFAYRNSKKEQFKQPVFQVLMHMFNHATYHRGQIVTMLRQLGVERIPATDFIVFTRSKK